MLNGFQTMIDKAMEQKSKTVDAIECSRAAISKLAQDLGHRQPAEVEYAAVISVVLCCISHCFDACKLMRSLVLPQQTVLWSIPSLALAVLFSALW